ncbi:hypothetical protein [Algiphilus sp.]|uniref:hypothetical protein n=1 Tax=Algiphilus sp. TaxID=1872431 RepID=UPI003B51D505
MKMKRHCAEGMPLRLNRGWLVIGDDRALDATTVNGSGAMKGGDARHLTKAREAATNAGVQALPRSGRGGLAPA